MKIVLTQNVACDITYLQTRNVSKEKFHRFCRFLSSEKRLLRVWKTQQVEIRCRKIRCFSNEKPFSEGKTKGTGDRRDGRRKRYS